MTTNYIDEIKKDFVEKGADLEHDRWARWHKYSRLMETPENREMWDRKAEMPYIGLTDKEQESDKVEVKKYLPLIEKIIQQVQDKTLEAYEEAGRNMYKQGKEDAKQEIIEKIKESHKFEGGRHETLQNIINKINQ